MNKIEIYTSGGFVFNKQSKKLETFKPISAQVNFANNTVVYECELGGVRLTMPREDVIVYASEASFRNSDPKLTTSFSFDYMLRAATDVKPVNGHEAWIFESGEAKLVDVSSLDFIYTYGRGIILAEGAPELYASSEEVYQFNDYIVKDENGVEHVRECPAGKLKMNDEQKSAVELFDNAVKALEDAGLKVFFDTENSEVQIIPIEPISDYCAYDDLDGALQLRYVSHNTKTSWFSFCSCEGGVRIVVK